MSKKTVSLRLRPLQKSHTKLFARWWCDPVLIRFTSGRTVRFSDGAIERAVVAMMKDAASLHRMIVIGKKTIGHISLSARPRGWHEIQIVIGEKQYWSRGYGTRAIRAMVRQARRQGIQKIYLEVRPRNHRAIRAYRRVGFVEMGIQQKRGNAFLKEVLRMECASSRA